MFDPFENRQSRDIRNTLSGYFLGLLQGGGWAEFERQAAGLLADAPDPDHTRFIEKRIRRYQAVFERGLDSGLDAFRIGRLLWDNGLFFECHEWIEPLWLDAAGPDKKALQGIIRAAGAQVLHEAGRIDAALSSARKAVALIRAHQNALPEAFEADELIRISEGLAPD